MQRIRKFPSLRKCTAEAPEAPRIPFMHPIPRGSGVPGQNPPKNLPVLEDHLRAKFHSNPSSSLDFYREHPPIHSDTQTHCPLITRRCRVPAKWSIFLEHFISEYFFILNYESIFHKAKKTILSPRILFVCTQWPKYLLITWIIVLLVLDTLLIYF